MASKNKKKKDKNSYLQGALKFKNPLKRVAFYNSSQRQVEKKITVQEFEQYVGYAPENDDMERVNCPSAGEFGHLQCGWCGKHQLPKFMCGC